MLLADGHYQHVRKDLPAQLRQRSMFANSFIVQHASIIMSISQISETLFILTIPFFLSRYGI
ncbi:hypothetical protein ACNKHV_18480 [Shigella flexneri]